MHIFFTVAYELEWNCRLWPGSGQIPVGRDLWRAALRCGLLPKSHVAGVLLAIKECRHTVSQPIAIRHCFGFHPTPDEIPVHALSTIQELFHSPLQFTRRMFFTAKQADE